MSKTFRNTVLGISIAYIIAGLVQILWPLGSRLAICYIIGAALTIFGIYHIARYFSGNADYLFALTGLALGAGTAVAGILLLICAKAVVAIFGVLMALAIIAASILRLQLSFNMMRMGNAKSLPVMIFSLVMLVAGVIMLFAPIESVSLAATLTGICMLADGIMSIISLAFARDIIRD